MLFSISLTLVTTVKSKDKPVRTSFVLGARQDKIANKQKSGKGKVAFLESGMMDRVSYHADQENEAVNVTAIKSHEHIESLNSLKRRTRILFTLSSLAVILLVLTVVFAFMAFRNHPSDRSQGTLRVCYFVVFLFFLTTFSNPLKVQTYRKSSELFTLIPFFR